VYTVRKRRKVRKRYGGDMSEPREYFTTGEAAAWLQLSIDTITRLWKRGALEGYKTTPDKGAHLRIYRDSVRKFDQARKEPAKRTG